MSDADVQRWLAIDVLTRARLQLETQLSAGPDDGGLHLSFAEIEALLALINEETEFVQPD
jgi:hypothetical protein